MFVNNEKQECGDAHNHGKLYATFPDILRFEVFTVVIRNNEASSDVKKCSLVPCWLHLHSIRNNRFKFCPEHGGSKIFRTVNC